ncbi:MAG: DNA mismatch repair endonuclease MutL, partial [Pseudomonadota bacterium]
MLKIHILPESLSNKIAAGEVVERPVSVVKELVENSIDAKSTRIAIELNQSGTGLIQVSDNGIGMPKKDALLSLERHATSKIVGVEDLFNIKTLGFRGEALPSIASVSRMEMITRSKENDSGTRITISGGRIEKVDETGAPIGTMISVRDLFFNIPARRKFLKSNQTELGQITDFITHTALAYHDIHFTLIHNQSTIADWPETNHISHRVAGVLGIKLWETMREINLQAEDIQVSGFVSVTTNGFRSTKRGLYVYVNNRFIRDKVIYHAIMEAYKGRLMSGLFPVAIIFVAVSPAEVDVNVHPAKNAVRFAFPEKVHNAIVDA